MTTNRQPLDYYIGLEYPYTVVPDDGSFYVEFPDLPNCFTQVDDASEIAAMAEEIRTLWIEGEYEDGHDIPEPSSNANYSGKFVVRLPKSLHRSLAESAEREGISLNSYVIYLLAERHAFHQGEQLRHVTATQSVESEEWVAVARDASRREHLTVIHRRELTA